MALPAIVVGGVAAGGRVALPVLMTGARSLAGRLLPASAQSVTRVAQATGVRGGIGKILGAMKDNKLMTAMVLLQLGSEGAEILSAMAAEDREIAEFVSRYGVTNDEVSDDMTGNLATQMDELQCIADAANAMGGLGRLHNLRRALSLSEAHYKLYDQYRTMAQVLG